MGSKVRLEDCFWRISLNDKGMSISYVAPGPHPKPKEGMLSKIELHALEDCYGKIMVACYPELKKEDIHFKDKENIAGTRVPAGESVYFYSDFAVEHTEKYSVNIEINPHVYMTPNVGGRVDVVVYNEYFEKIDIKKTQIAENALVNAIVSLICFAEYYRCIKIDNGYKLEEMHNKEYMLRYSCLDLDDDTSDKAKNTAGDTKKVVLSENYNVLMYFTRGKMGLHFGTLDPHSENEIVKVRVTKNMLDELESIYSDFVKALFPELEGNIRFRGKARLIDMEMRADRDDAVIWVGVDGSEEIFKEFHISIRNHVGPENETDRYIGTIVKYNDSDDVPPEEKKINEKAFMDAAKKFISFTEHGRQVEVADSYKKAKSYNYLYYKVINSGINTSPDTPRKTVYISFASADLMRVMPIAQEIQQRGYYVIWDFFMVAEGTASDSVLNEKESIDTSDFYIIFISRAYIDTYPHTDEMNYALGWCHKKCIPVYLESVELPYGMKRFLVTNKNAVNKYKFNDEQDFYNELFSDSRLG
jgi:hypothetical protein